MGLNKTKTFVKEPIEWDRLTTIVITIVVLFFFTRSAPFPTSTFWELAIARDFNSDITRIFFPEIISLEIVDPSTSSFSAIISGLQGLKAIYHIIYFILCSAFCFWIFKNKEPLPGLIGLAVYAFSMQAFLNLRMLLTLHFIVGTIFILDHNYLKKRFGLVFIPIIVVASYLGLNSLLLISLILCYVFFSKKHNFSLIICAFLGGLIFPNSFITSFDNNLIFNWCFIPNFEMQMLYILSSIFLLINLVSMGKMTKQDLPTIVFYAISGLFALIQPTYICVFITMGLFVLIKLYSNQKPLSILFQVIGILVITAIVYIYLFINPFGIKLNPSVRNQLGKELTPLTEGFEKSMEIENYNIGELIWKGMIRIDNQEKIKELYKKDKLELVKTNNDEYKIIELK